LKVAVRIVQQFLAHIRHDQAIFVTADVVGDGAENLEGILIDSPIAWILSGGDDQSLIKIVAHLDYFIPFEYFGDGTSR